jgi:hypothetical protein
MSDNLAWSVRGMRTNSLLVHYVEHHRDEVPEAELAKLLRFETDRHAEWMKGTTHGSK